MIKQHDSGFRVDVDGKLCFESSKIRLPLGYNFGITAASAENPDSFEIFKFENVAPSSKEQHPHIRPSTRPWLLTQRHPLFL
jgi:hypothetical protein